MMKKLLCIGLVVALGAVSADAALFTTWADGALRLKLRYDYATGQAWLINLDSSVAQGGPVDTVYNVDGSTIKSVAGNLVPALTWNTVSKTATNGWLSIGDSVSKQTIATINALGGDTPGFGRVVASATELTEVNLSGFAAFTSDGSALNTPWGIGKPIKVGTALSDLTFTYHTPDAGGNAYLGVIEVINVPEPATMCVLAVGGISMLLRKRRRS